MIVTRSDMDEYTAEVNAISEEAAQVAMDAYDEMRKSNLNASVAEVRDGIIGIVESMVASYGGASSEIAAEVYDALAESAGADVEPAELDEEDDAMRAAIDKRARYIVGDLVQEREDI